MFKKLIIFYLKLKSKIFKDYTIFALDKDVVFTFKNGSVIKTVPSSPSEIIRGKRSEIIDWSDTQVNTKDLDEVLKNYLNSH